MKKETYRLLLNNIKQVLAVSSKQPFLKIQQCAAIEPLQNYSIAIDANGNISKIGPAKEVQQWVEKQQIHFDVKKDCSNLIAFPGFVDAHTHALFAGNRSKQFDMKLNGMNYTDIYNLGLGIRFTTEQIRATPLDDLVIHLQKYLKKMNRLGTTTVQIKSGYGFNAESQVKMLRAIEIARNKFAGKIQVISTFCGAHAIPKGKTEAEQTKDVIESQIPAVKAAMDKGEINPKFIDVFCQKNFFERQSSIAIMKSGKEIGLVPSFHGDELNNLQSGEIASEVGAVAVSHLEFISESSIKLMALKNIAAVMLPTTQNIEKLPIPPIKLMRQHNMIVALGSDFCPNAHCYSMPLVCHFACTNYRLTPKEALAAATINSAYALGVSKTQGSLQEGKKGDIVLLDAPDWVCLVYYFGDSPIEAVIKQGILLT